MEQQTACPPTPPLLMIFCCPRFLSMYLAYCLRPESVDWKRLKSTSHLCWPLGIWGMQKGECHFKKGLITFFEREKWENNNTCHLIKLLAMKTNNIVRTHDKWTFLIINFQPFLLQERNLSNASLTVATGGLPTRVIGRNTATFTPQTNRTIAKSVDVTSPTLTHQVYENTWR